MGTGGGEGFPRHRLRHGAARRRDGRRPPVGERSSRRSRRPRSELVQDAPVQGRRSTPRACTCSRKTARPCSPRPANRSSRSARPRRAVSPRGAELEVLTVGRVSVDLYPEQIGVLLAGVRNVPEDAGRQPDERRGRRGAARPAERRDHEGGRRPVRAVRPRGAGGLRRRLRPASAPTPISGHRSSSARSSRRTTSRCSSTASPRRPTSTSGPVTSTWTRCARCRCSGQAALRCRRSRAASSTLAALAARSGGITVHDLDYRPMFWRSPTRPGGSAGRRCGTRPWLSVTRKRSRSSWATSSRTRRPRHC